MVISEVPTVTDGFVKRKHPKIKVAEIKRIIQFLLRFIHSPPFGAGKTIKFRTSLYGGGETNIKTVVLIANGLAADMTLAVKAGRKSSGINNLVWIGESVALASKLSNLGNKNGVNPIVMSERFYSNYIEVQKAKLPNKDLKDWWKKEWDPTYGIYYHDDIVKSDFYDWIIK